MTRNSFIVRKRINSCHGCDHTRVDVNKTRVECDALNGRRLCWLGEDGDKLKNIPDFCPFLEKNIVPVE